MNDSTLVGALLRGVVSLGVLLLGSGVAARLCRDTRTWIVAATIYAAVFAWLMWGVVPRPEQHGLLYSVQWGVFGAAAYSAWRASAKAPDPVTADEEGSETDEPPTP